jgi:acetyl esterase/lipase
LLDLEYSREQVENRRLDLFLPEQDANGGCILFIHGGGFSGGSRKQWRPVAEHFCKQGFVCVSAGYRLAPKWIFPSQLEDVRLAMAFVRSNAERYGFSPSRIAAQGSSAGGYLVAMLATIQPGDSIGATPELMIQDTRPNAAVCYCSVTTFRPWGGHGESVAQFLGKTEREAPELYRAASPQDRVCGKEPPFLFLHGDADETVSVAHSVMMCNALRGAGGDAEVVLLPDVQHGYGYGVTTPAQLESVAHVGRFLRSRFCIPEPMPAAC